MKIVFMGTPEFAAVLLERILASGVHEVAAVVTVPDKAVGRGLKLTPSAVKVVAERHAIPLLQPARLRDEAFLRELKAYDAELFVVIAFRMLPEVVWRMPPKGTVNLHASLLPSYRGAAPIQRAIMNGETETGVTTFFINERIDEGELLLSQSVPIAPEETGGELHDALLEAGGPLLLETLRQIERGEYRLTVQETKEGGLPMAPKIFKEDCLVDWGRSAERIFNQIRALSPYPGAYTMVRRKGEGAPVLMKLFRVRIAPNAGGLPQGMLFSDDRQTLLIAASDACLRVEELQLFGKRRMTVREFLAGNKGYDGAQCT